MCNGQTHDQKCTQTIFWQGGNAQFAHDLFSEHVNPTITHSNQTTYQAMANANNNNITLAK